MKTKTFGLVALLAAGVLTLTGCGNTETPNEENAEIANPASVYCEENGGISIIETAEDWSQSWICTFADGSYCEEWAYFRGECEQGEIIYNTISDETGAEEVNDEEVVAEEVNDEDNIANNGDEAGEIEVELAE